MNVLRRMFLLSIIACLAGCSGGTVSDTEVEVTPQEVNVKNMLQDVAETGQLGSGAMSISDALESMKVEGDPKAEELLKDLEELKKLDGEPAKLKKKASEMAAKL